jgi:hypothetical protein
MDDGEGILVLEEVGVVLDDEGFMEDVVFMDGADGIMVVPCVFVDDGARVVFVAELDEGARVVVVAPAFNAAGIEEAGIMVTPWTAVSETSRAEITSFKIILVLLLGCFFFYC